MIIARHAISQANRGEVGAVESRSAGLTPEGIEQARRLGESLYERKIDIDRIVSSSLVRTMETARIVREILSIKDRGRDDRDFRFDEWRFPPEFLSDPHSFRTLAKLARNPSTYAPEWAESFESVAQRMRDGLGEIAKTSGNRTLVVTHRLCVEALLHSFGNGPSGIGYAKWFWFDAESGAVQYPSEL